MRRKILLISVLVLLMLFAVAPLMSLSVKAEESTGKSEVGTAAVQPAATIFTDDFEGAWYWTATDLNSASGYDYWGLNTIYGQHGGNGAAWCCQISDHPYGATYYDLYMQAFMYRTVSLSSYSSVTLSYWYWTDTEPTYDYLQAIYRVGTTWYVAGATISGAHTTWTQVSVSIPNTANAVGFYFFSDYSNCNYMGAMVDDVSLTGTPTAYGSYHFNISPFTDVMNINAGGGVINGIDVASSYTVSVLGSYSGNNFYMAIALGQYASNIYKLAYLVGTISTKSGTLYRTIDGTSWIATAVTLVPVTSTEQVAEKPSMGSAGASGPKPEGWPATNHFTMSPFVDVVNVYAGGGLINGQDTYSATVNPLLGSYSGNNFYMAISYSATSTYKLSFLVGTVSTATGTLYRTTDGTSWITTAVRLVPL